MNECSRSYLNTLLKLRGSLSTESKLAGERSQIYHEMPSQQQIIDSKLLKKTVQTSLLDIPVRKEAMNTASTHCIGSDSFISLCAASFT